MLQPRHLAVLLLASLPLAALAQEATLRKNLAERIPALKDIDEVTKSPIAGLYEVRVGNDILYSDADGNYLLQGALVDTKTRRNLTQERVDKLSAIAFNDLPLKNAFTLVRGNGKRKLAVFEDPNCGYCKKFEKNLQSINDVTVYLFLVPILGPDSVEKTNAIWCAKDRAQAWNDWMLKDVVPPNASCNTDAITANLELARKHRITGTPTLIFPNNTRVPGAIPASQVEQLLAR